jgi:primosomal protein N' (replication factor Y)
LGHFVQVVVNIPTIHGRFDYHLPDELIGRVGPGCLVEVPFGRQTVQAVVLQMKELADIPETRPVSALVDPQPVLTPHQMALAEWLENETLNPLSILFDTMLPPGLSQQTDTQYSLTGLTEDHVRSETQSRLLELLKKRGDLRGRQLDAAFPHVEWRSSAKVLIKRGLVQAVPILLPPTVRPKMVRTVQLACSPQEAQQRTGNLGRGAAHARRQSILELLIKEPWPVEVTWVYAVSGGNFSDLQALAEVGLVLLGEGEVWRDPLSGIQVDASQALVLTADQTAALQLILQGVQAVAEGKEVKPYLLHGVTGSGKTEIYLQAAAETLKLGRQVVILVPEIALTPQTVRRFMARFPGQVGLVHSRLSPGERYDTWRRVRQGELPVIVGARSALFAPLASPGLVVVDECHDGSYYQDDIPPVYHAVSAARAYAQVCGAALVLGSATPSVDLYYQAQRQGWFIVKLPERILAHTSQSEPGVNVQPAEQSLPPVQVVDMREELKQGNRSIFSRALHDAIENTLNRGEQAILFLNRLGAATYVFCRDCGLSLKCPRCDMPLTFHQIGESTGLVCHRCNYRRQVPKKCPQCGSVNIRQMGLGTEKVESELVKIFPTARILRLDSETTRTKGAHEMILTHFANHQADILVGAQMLSKGLDLPKVTLVGVVLADVGLNLPDYRAGERAFQLLTQVAGRAGRSVLAGKVIFQSFKPDDPAIRFAAMHDYAGFYTYEIGNRRQMMYPPFSRLVRLEYRHMDARKAEDEAMSMANQLDSWIMQTGARNIELIGPAPAFFGRVNSYYRWLIILRGTDPVSILQGKPLGEWRVCVDPISML